MRRFRPERRSARRKPEKARLTPVRDVTAGRHKSFTEL